MVNKVLCGIFQGLVNTWVDDRSKPPVNLVEKEKLATAFLKQKKGEDKRTKKLT